MFKLFKKEKPNIIMILVDGVRYDSIEKVPFYSNLKKEATFFSQMITYAPYTIASLHATFSGMYGNRNGVNGYYRSFNFDKNCITLQQYIKNAGYNTECDLIREDVLPHQGFDVVREHDEFTEDLKKRHSEILLRIKSKQPFFLFLDYSNVHTNLINNIIKKYDDFSEEYFQNTEENSKKYLEWVNESADYLNTILKKIKSLGLWESSVIVIFNDHGASVGDKMGEKVYGSYLYDYTIRCFLYMIGKQFPKGKEITNLIRSIDIMPTILDVLELKEISTNKKMQGKSLFPIINGEMDNRIAYSETGGLGGPTPSPQKHNVKSVRTEKWKLIYNETTDKKELYNLENNPQETVNLIGKEKELEKYLMEKLKIYQE